MPPVVVQERFQEVQDLTSLSSAPTPAAAIMRNVPELLRTRLELREGGRWAEAAREISEFLSPPIEAGQIPGRNMSPLKIAVLGEKGGLFHDIVGATSRRDLAQVVSAQALSIIAVADHHIDEFGWGPHQRVATLNSLLSSVTDGTVVKMPTLQLTRAAELGAQLHATIRDLPGASMFVDEFGALAAAVCRQIKDAPTLELCAEVGGRVSALSALSSYLVEPKLPRQYLDAARHWGAYVGLTDDVRDMREDIENGNPSCISVADKPLEVCARAEHLAVRHLADALLLLPETGRAKLRARQLLSSSDGRILTAV